MKFVVFFTVSVIISPTVVSAFEFLTAAVKEVNLTDWREHRRKKRFILFENAGVLKLVTAFSYPIDLADKKSWRQLTVSYNLHYQFPVAGKPVYWWNKWNVRNLPNGQATFNTAEAIEKYKDEAQEFLYKFVENLIERQGGNGRACLQRLICENAQIHKNLGLYAEILHRILQPHRNLNSNYTEAWHLGKRLMNCRVIYFEAKNCLLDDYVHLRKDSLLLQRFVKDMKRK